MKPSIFFIIVFALLTSVLANTVEQQTQYQLDFSSQENNGIPINAHQQNFDCSNQIYAIINASNLQDQPIKATLIWRNPAGKIQEKTPISLFPVEGKALGWAWLKLHKTAGAALLSFIDDSIGMDKFIGDWEIELKVDNKKVAAGSFNVLC